MAEQTHTQLRIRLGVYVMGALDPPDILAAHLDLTPGSYVLRWQVLAVDGHITRGDVPFTVTVP